MRAIGRRCLRSCRRFLAGLLDRFPPARRMVGERALIARHRRLFGRRLDVRRPVRFTDRLFVAMIANNRRCDPRLIALTDKYRARALIAARIGERHLVKLLWHGAKPDEIPFERLPAAFVAKTNHGCGMVVCVKGDADRRALVDRLYGWLREDYSRRSREAQYHAIAPMVLIEEYLCAEDGEPLVTLRFWCFGGTVAFVQVDGPVAGITAFYDPCWRPLDLAYRDDRRHADFARPAGFDDAAALAGRLAAGFDFVRVDLYVAGDRILFNEMTFTPAAGALRFRPPHWDWTLGRIWGSRAPA